jgi:hypothetical protein
VDVVTTRLADVNSAIYKALDAESPPFDFSRLTAVSYRPTRLAGNGQLLAWPVPLEIGRPLPTLPLWLGAELSAPLDLEISYTAACVDLRIRHAG